MHEYPMIPRRTSEAPNPPNVLPEQHSFVGSLCTHCVMDVWSLCDDGAIAIWLMSKHFVAIVLSRWSFESRYRVVRGICDKKSVGSLMEPCFAASLTKSPNRRVCKSIGVSVMLVKGVIRKAIAKSEATRYDQSKNPCRYDKAVMCHSIWTGDLNNRRSTYVVFIH